MAILFSASRFKATDKANQPVAGAFLAFYATSTSTFQPIYADSELTAVLTNPVQADANGLFPEIWLDDSLSPYKIVHTSPDINNPSIPGSVIWTIPKYNNVFDASSFSQTLLPFINQQTSAEISVGITPVNYAYAAGNVKRHGAIGDGITDDTAAIQRCFNAQAQTSGASVFFPAGTYLVTSGFTLTRSIQITGEGAPCGGTGSAIEPYSIILKSFNGDLFTFNAASGSLPASGGGIENLRLVQNSGTSITANGGGTAIKLVGTSLTNRPSWMKIRNVLIEYAVGKDSWTWGIDVDGTAITGNTIPDLWFNQISCHTASSNGGAVRFKAATAKMFDCAFYDTAGNVTISGISGTPSSGIILFNTDISGTLAIDWANDITVFGGSIGTITNTANTGGNCTLLPGRLTNPFTSANNNAGAHFGLLRFDPQAFASAAGSFRCSQPIALENAQSLHGLNSGGTAALRLIRANASNRVEISGDGADVQFGQATVALGGGSTATLGTIGASGPASSGQAGWGKFFDASGNAFYMPFWR